MTDRLDHAIKTISRMPQAKQNEIAELILEWVGDDASEHAVPAEDVAAVREGLAQLDRGESVTGNHLRQILKSLTA